MKVTIDKNVLLFFIAFGDRKIDLIVESDWKWWVIGKGVLTVRCLNFVSNCMYFTTHTRRHLKKIEFQISHFSHCQ